MVRGSKALKIYDINEWDTSEVTDMSGLFLINTNLIWLEVGMFQCN